MEEARGRVLNHIFVLGGRAALCGRVCVRLVADGHLYGKPQPLLVNLPGKGHRSVRAALAGVTNGKKKKKKLSGGRNGRLTRCASLRPGSRSLPSRWLFYPLSRGR